MQLHHLQGVLTLYFAKVSKLLKLQLNKSSRLKCSSSDRTERASFLPSIYSCRKIRLDLCECRIMPGLHKDISRIKCNRNVLLFPKVERWNRYYADPDPDFYGFSQSLPQNGGNTRYASIRSRFHSQPPQLRNQSSSTVTFDALQPMQKANTVK